MSDKIDELQTQAVEADERAAKWQELHTEATIKRELTEAAEEGGAFSADQLYPYLRPSARLVEVDGQQLVRIVKTDQQGQETMFTPKEAIAHLRQVKDLENLFKSAPAAQPALTAPPKIDWKNMSHDQFLNLRAELGLAPKRR
jgi:hypothetical protein